MKRLFFLLLAISFLLPSFAQLNGTGYYRVKNYGSQRYIYVCDGTSAGINFSTTSADMGAIQTWTGLDKAITDPASVIYAKNVGGDNWDLMAQGTGVHQLINYYVGVTELSRESNIYQVSATASGMTMYLYDTETSSSPRGRLGTGSSGSTSVPAKYSRWQVYGIDPSSDNYVAVAPSINVNGKYYAPYYASYPFSFYSSGMKAYYVSKIDKEHKVVVIKELNGIVPSATPIIVECSSSAVASNKLKLEAYESYNNRPADNKLSGVYFSNQYRESPVAYKLYDKNTMRVLGKTSSGKLGFITATNDMLHNCGDSDETLWCLKANNSYLTVENGTASELTIVTEQEYEDNYNRKVTSVTLSQSTLSLRVGQTSTLTATVAPSDAINKTLTWSSSNTAVATIENGVVTAKSVGSATISAKTNDGSNITANCQVTVTPALVASISLNLTNAEVKEGETFQLTATVLPDYAGNKVVSWKSSNTAVATVDINGKVTAIKAGNAEITATSTDGSNISAKCSVKVNPILAQSITLDKTSIEDIHGKQFQLSATVLPANTSNKGITWSTSNASVATVDNGLVTLVAAGNAVITVKTVDGSNLTATCQVKVNPILVSNITLNQASAELNIGENIQLTATVLPENADNKNITWSSSNTDIATVDANGKVTAKSVGDANIIATSCDGTNVKAVCTIKVKPVLVERVFLNQSSATGRVGEHFQLMAVVTPDNATNKELVWESSNEEVATVYQGSVSLLALGDVIITARTTDGSNISASCQVTVVPTLAESITLNQTIIDARVGDQIQLIATVLPTGTTNKDVVWSIDDENIATVDNGLVTILNEGEATITVSTIDGSNLSARCKITSNPMLATDMWINPTTLTMVEGETAQIYVTVFPDRASSTSVEWSSSNETVVSVNANGIVTANAQGEAKITVHTTDGSNLYAYCDVVVNIKSGIASIKADSFPEGTKYYTISGQSIPAPRKGLIIVRYKDGKTAKVNVE